MFLRVASLFAHTTLRRKLVVAFMLVAMTPLGILGLVNERAMRSSLIHTSNEVLLAAARHTATQIDDFVDSNLNAIRTEAKLPILSEYLGLRPRQRPGSEEESEAVSTLRALSLKDNVYVSSYALLDGRGVNLADTNGADIGKDRADRDYFQQPVQTGLPSATSVEVSAGRFGETGMYFSSPVRDKSGTVIGVLVARYRAAILQRLIVENNGLAGAGSFAILLDENHMRLGHGADPDLRFRTVIPLGETRLAQMRSARRLPDLAPSELSTDLPSFERGLQSADSEPYFTSELAAVDEPAFVAVTRMETLPWLVVFAQSQEAFLAPIQLQTRNAIVLGAVIAVLVVLLAIGVSHVLIGPITRLTGVVKRISEGDLSARVKVESSGEIGTLGAAFNSMTTRLSGMLEDLEYAASHDALTALVNRQEFERRLQRVLETARAEQVEHALCYLDLDQFKVINDTCGHVAGDELLAQIAMLLRGQVRERDTLARLGGDEFGVLMEHCSLAQAERVAKALREAIEGLRFVWEGRSFDIGVSIGLVSITEFSESIANVLSAADRACYAAKDEGRNRVHVYHEDNAELARRHGEMQWATRIPRALEEHRFHLVSQPIVPLNSGVSRGEHYEVLIRMEDEEGRIVLPGAFLPAAERYNLSVKIDRWVTGRTLQWLADDPKRLRNLFLCTINLSGHSLGDEAFLQFIIRLFDQSNVPPKKICFEITETATIANLFNATRFMKALKELGCQFALDDFGSGFSSFAYLKSLPVDFLKIDGVFVRDIVDDPINLAMVKSINEIGHAMGKRTIAEHVENDAILEKLLSEIGVDYVQGYGIARPQRLGKWDEGVLNLVEM